MIPNSEIIKTALLSYFRFKRQWICATEAHCGICGELADVMVDTGKEIREIEVKCSKQDLWQGEKKKAKHKWYNIGHRDIPNSYYICVPTELIDEAKKWVETTNNKYGIIEFHTNYFQTDYFRFEECLTFIKRAKSISSVYSQRLKKNIIYRMCSELVMEKQNRLNKYIWNQKSNNE